MVKVFCFESIEVCKPETDEIFKELFVIVGCNPFKTVWRFKTDELLRELLVIVGCNPDRAEDNPEISFIVNPFTIPLEVALLQIKLPEASIEKVLLLFFKVPVYWGELIKSSS